MKQTCWMKLCEFDDTELGSTKLTIEIVEEIEDLDSGTTNLERTRGTMWVCPSCARSKEDELMVCELQPHECETVEVFSSKVSQIKK